MMPMNDDDVNLRVIQADSQRHVWPMATLDGPDWKMNDCTDIKSIKSTSRCIGCLIYVTNGFHLPMESFGSQYR